VPLVADHQSTVSPKPNPSTPPAPPSLPALPCHKVSISETLLFSKLTFNRAVTHDLKTSLAEGATIARPTLGYLCGLAAEATAGVAALLCGAVATEIALAAEHAGQCDGKNQCLQIKVPQGTLVALPFCVGEKDGCCGSK
jgi:hypothetical protein